jgi:hypothetical protein
MEKHTHILIANGQGYITWFGPNPPSKEFMDAINRMADKIINLPEPELTKTIERARYITDSLSKDPAVIRRNMLKDLGIAPPINEIKVTLGHIPEEPDPDGLEKDGYSFETGM